MNCANRMASSHDEPEFKELSIAMADTARSQVCKMPPSAMLKERSVELLLHLLNDQQVGANLDKALGKQSMFYGKPIPASLLCDAIMGTPPH